MFMSSCTLFVFFSLIEYAIVNVMMGDISDIERKDKDPSSVSHIRNIIKIGHNKLARKTTICINKVIKIHIFALMQYLQLTNNLQTDADSMSMEQSSTSQLNPPAHHHHHHHYGLGPPSPSRTTSLHHAPHISAYDQEHHHSAPNIHENFTPPPVPAHPTHPPPPLPKCPRHGGQEKKMVSSETSASVLPSSKSLSKPKVKDTKEIMKKRRERAICVVWV